MVGVQRHTCRLSRSEVNAITLPFLKIIAACIGRRSQTHGGVDVVGSRELREASAGVVIVIRANRDAHAAAWIR